MTLAEEETVVVAAPDFRRKRRFQRLRRWRPYLIALAALAAVGTAGYAVWFSSWLTVREVEVAGTGSLSPTAIERAARVPMDRQLARVDLAAIQARVEALPPVKSAAVSRSWPRAIQITVTERVPLAVVDRGAALQAVDEDGVLFGRYPRRPADLPLVRTRADVRAEALAEAARVVDALRADIATRVRYVDVETIDRIELQMRDGREVAWGSAEQSAQKAEVLAVLLDQKAQHIDVSVPSRPTTR